MHNLKISMFKYTLKKIIKYTKLDKRNLSDDKIIFSG